MTKNDEANHDAALARSMMDLENDILDLRDMSSIMEALVEHMVEGTGIVDKNGDRIVELREYEVRRLVFASHEVERRARELSDRYQNSFPGVKEVQAARARAHADAA